jgi:hypothetical protein
MKADLRPLRDAEIVRLYRAKVPQVEIGRRLGLRPPRVYTILVKAGEIVPGASPRKSPKVLAAEGIWGADEDRRRAAFHQRARAAARAALEAMHG